MDPRQLLEQFLGPEAGQRLGDQAGAVAGKARGAAGGFGGGLAAGGLLGLVVGNKKARKKLRKLAGGAVGYGGAAALGALGHRAWQQWQAGKAAPEQPQALAPPPADSRFLPQAAPASNGQPFELALVTAMIAAANADGHIDADEQRGIFERVNAMPLDAEDKGFVFDRLSNPPSLAEVATLAEGPEQAAELYLASRLAIDPDHPAEQAYLDALAGRLQLPGGLREQLDAQVAMLPDESGNDR